MRFGVSRLFVFVLFFVLLLDINPAWDRIKDRGALSVYIDRVLPSKSQDLFVVLKNGMVLLTRREPRNDIFSVYIYVRAGSIYEKPLGGGLSHYLEHIVAGGTTSSFSEDEARQQLERLGGASNAYTGYDRTVYFINTTSSHWREALDLILSHVYECKLEKAEVSREKGVIRQEIRMCENDPARQLWDLFLRTAYQVHPVRYPVIGFEPLFSHQDRRSLLEYYRQRYQPQNMVLAAVGNVNPQDVVHYVAKRVARFRRSFIEPIVFPKEPPQISPRWSVKSSKIARITHVMIGFPSVTLTNPDLYALDVAAMILGEGKTSRLYRRLKERESLVLGVNAYNWTPAFVRGQFIINLQLDSRNWPAALRSLKDELELFKKEGATEEELQKAKRMVLAEHIFARESNSKIASSLAASFFDTGNPYFDDLYVDAIRHVKRRDIRRVALRYLDTKKMNIAVIEPVQKAGRYEKQGTAVIASVTSKGVFRAKLANGLRVLLKEDHTLPLVIIQLYGLGGVLLEDGDKPGISHFTSSLLTAGTKTRSKQEILSSIEDIGGQIATGSGRNTYFVYIKVLKEDLHHALDILSDIVQNASFPKGELEKQRRETLLAIKRRDENWQREIMRLFAESYFKDHPYRHDPLGTKESVESFTRSDVLKFYRRMVCPNHSVLAVYGDFDEKALLDEIKAKFSSWLPVKESLPRPPDESSPLRDSRVIEYTNNKSAVSIFVGTNGITIDDPARPALDVLDALISGIGYPGGRLEKALRGGKHDLVYVVHAFPFYGIRGGYFGVIAQTSIENMDKVQDIVLNQLKLLQSTLVDDGELQCAKDVVITMHKLSLETLGSQARHAALNEVLGLGWDYDSKYVDFVRHVSAFDIRKLARRLFSHTLIVRTIPKRGGGEATP